MSTRISNFRILLGRENTTPLGEYYAGSNVTGSVIFTLYEPLKIRAIIIKFSGRARTSWSENKTVRSHTDDNHRSIMVTYTANEEYFSNKYNLVGGPNSTMVLAAGNHAYPFCSALPSTLPSSFESKHGSVKYKVKCTIDLPWKFDTHAESVLNVITPINLNCIDGAKTEVNLVLEKWFCCCWCRSGPLTVILRLPYSGYVPGQPVPVTLEVDNASRKVAIDRIVVSLIKEVKWKAHLPQHKEREEKTEMKKLTLDGVEPGASKTYMKELVVPPFMPPNLDQCAIIKCNFYVKVEAEVSGMHCNLSGSVPIYLGTVPLASADAWLPAGDFPHHQVPSAPPPTIGFNVPPGQSTAYEDPPPPYPGIQTPAAAAAAVGPVPYMTEKDMRTPLIDPGTNFM